MTLTDPRCGRAAAGSGMATARDPELSQLLGLYRIMLVARHVDEVEAEMTSGGEAFFHVSGSGHEGSAVLNLSLIPEDWLHLHYRDKALMLARGIPPVMFFHSLLCNAASHSAGRQMSAHMSDPDRRILSTVGPVGNNALQAVGVASVDQTRRDATRSSSARWATGPPSRVRSWRRSPRRSVPNCPSSSGSRTMPMRFPPRPDRKTFYSLPQWCGEAERFYGLPIHRLNGRDDHSCWGQVESIVEQMRRTRRPGIAVFEVDRLSDHTNSDDERVYRPREEIDRVRRQERPDPPPGRMR